MLSLAKMAGEMSSEGSWTAKKNRQQDLPDTHHERNLQTADLILSFSAYLHNKRNYPLAFNYLVLYNHLKGTIWRAFQFEESRWEKSR
jgi:hypothetical protein